MLLSTKWQEVEREVGRGKIKMKQSSFTDNVATLARLSFGPRNDVEAIERVKA
jgi:hypothetical protein